MSHLLIYYINVCIHVGDVPPTPLSPFEPHTTAIFSPILRFTVKMERGIAVLTKATDSLTPVVRGTRGGWAGRHEINLNRQLSIYILTCVTIMCELVGLAAVFSLEFTGHK